ncbi:hypothetical protein [Candidatus Litorirhabdus singularis]|nr:hypothetical protein [Candidatus Litorirhabdus singularis]
MGLVYKMADTIPLRQAILDTAMGGSDGIHLLAVVARPESATEAKKIPR